MYYVGRKENQYEVFTSAVTPSEGFFGHRYRYVIGPFANKLAAIIMAHHGQGNPHLQHASDANRLARKGVKWLRDRGFRV